MTTGNVDGAAIAVKRPRSDAHGVSGHGDPSGVPRTLTGLSGRTTTVVAMGITTVAATLALITVGQRGFNAVILTAVLWVIFDRIELLGRGDQATDNADRAMGRIDAVECHLSGLETAGAGKHAKGRN